MSNEKNNSIIFIIFLGHNTLISFLFQALEMENLKTSYSLWCCVAFMNYKNTHPVKMIHVIIFANNSSHKIT